MTTIQNGQTDPRLIPQNGSWGRSNRHSGSSESGSSKRSARDRSQCLWGFLWALVVIVVLLAVLLPIMLIILPDEMECDGYVCGKTYHQMGPSHPGVADIDPGVYTQTLLFIADGLYDYSMPSAEFAMEFLRDQMHMGRNRMETIEQGRMAAEFFYNHLGLDFRNVREEVFVGQEKASLPGVDFQAFMLASDTRFRCTHMAGMETSRSFSNMRVVDLGWIIQLTEPAEYFGLMYQPGAMGLWGHYSIRPSPTEHYLIHYEIGDCLMNGINDTIFGNSQLVNCNVYEERWGWGTAGGIFAHKPDGTGRRKLEYRDVLTFPRTFNMTNNRMQNMVK